ncbi:MAG TPA: hypothetical protein DIT64_15240 [Verrucomicrobiales bacterium]|nr:hypothetical protein [Verrucomicrobiales bacterium]HCN77494.1 hypothetical protein [Verrucomicrobiales bacterium]HRJ07070.1 recombination protein O N-terminal domain-containing protein [Prosthecobacter sp.]HRK13162.1 recombination protein O N-terminal domain-containing protein [Prosthecobacter sp.]
MEKTEAILIGRTRWSETSLIIHWCSPGLGLFRTIAKGALRPKSPFQGVLDLFVSAEIRFVPAKKSDLHTLAEAHCLNPRLGLRASYGRVLAATYFTRLLTLAVEPHSPLPALHELLDRALDFLGSHDPSRAMLERFELRVAEDLGLIGEKGAPGSEAARILEDHLHKRLPAQRAQVLAWCADHP